MSRELDLPYRLANEIKKDFLKCLTTNPLKCLDMKKMKQPVFSLIGYQCYRSVHLCNPNSVLRAGAARGASPLRQQANNKAHFCSVLPIVTRVDNIDI